MRLERRSRYASPVKRLWLAGRASSNFHGFSLLTAMGTYSSGAMTQRLIRVCEESIRIQGLEVVLRRRL
jgi:hypothetical protein